LQIHLPQALKKKPAARWAFLLFVPDHLLFVPLTMPHRTRANIKPGMLVNVVQKHHQRSGELTEGIVKNLLTSAPHHHHGIKVRLDDGTVGRVKEIIEEDLD
jgi:uncharacterized repeat protein (TIGR03833 family)